MLGTESDTVRLSVLAAINFVFTCERRHQLLPEDHEKFRRWLLCVSQDNPVSISLANRRCLQVFVE